MLATIDHHELAIPEMLAAAGQAANRAASRGVFLDYQDRKAANTLRRQSADLDLFAQFLKTAGLEVGNFENDPEAWRGITWGLVQAFVRWQLAQGYAVPSVNVRLSTIKVYAKLALKAGVVGPQEYALIRAVEGYQHKEIKRIDEQRSADNVPTRYGSKKAQPVSIAAQQARALKDQQDTPQGRRDRLMMCLMLDHGLRVGEVVILTVDCFDLKEGELHFYRPKVDRVQTHKLSKDTLSAARAYLAKDAPAAGIVWRGSRKGRGGLQDPGMSERSMTERVRILGEAIEIHGLSAHDCRHYWATQAARNHTPLDRLQDAGGWSSLAMPSRYIEFAKIANQGVILGGD